MRRVRSFFPVLAVGLGAQKLQLEENEQNVERAMARVQNTQRMEKEDNKMKAEEDLRKQRIELASTKRGMKANQKKSLRAFVEFPTSGKALVLP